MTLEQSIKAYQSLRTADAFLQEAERLSTGMADARTPKLAMLIHTARVELGQAFRTLAEEVDEQRMRGALHGIIQWAKERSLAFRSGK